MAAFIERTLNAKVVALLPGLMRGAAPPELTETLNAINKNIVTNQRRPSDTPSFYNVQFASEALGKSWRGKVQQLQQDLEWPRQLAGTDPKARTTTLNVGELRQLRENLRTASSNCARLNASALEASLRTLELVLAHPQYLSAIAQVLNNALVELTRDVDATGSGAFGASTNRIFGTFIAELESQVQGLEANWVRPEELVQKVGMVGGALRDFLLHLTKAEQEDHSPPQGPLIVQEDAREAMTPSTSHTPPNQIAPLADGTDDCEPGLMDCVDTLVEPDVEVATDHVPAPSDDELNALCEALGPSEAPPDGFRYPEVTVGELDADVKPDQRLLDLQRDPSRQVALVKELLDDAKLNGERAVLVGPRYTWSDEEGFQRRLREEALDNSRFVAAGIARVPGAWEVILDGGGDHTTAIRLLLEHGLAPKWQSIALADPKKIAAVHSSLVRNLGEVDARFFLSTAADQGVREGTLNIKLHNLKSAYRYAQQIAKTIKDWLLAGVVGLWDPSWGAPAMTLPLGAVAQHDKGKMVELISRLRAISDRRSWDRHARDQRGLASLVGKLTSLLPAVPSIRLHLVHLYAVVAGRDDPELLNAARLP
ncbi:unnamed protein product [Pedinophyceae sp. YPF-701]|nr:unnamed protein product [Pedinophyceae sp. YPF-701]